MTQHSNVARIAGQMAGAGRIRTRAMFGQYGVYCDDTFIGVICNDRLFVKVTKAGRTSAPDLPLEPAYDGAKPSLAIPEDRIEDGEWLSRLIRTTTDALAKPAKR
ncbi:TfoX/Sxy family protein [Oceaniovalibus sp. ACAM 378]|jgi:TfoX/Sxy family transcriptional regulator of competence genes|uniref:TfoX/Sxy family protein n=1 Tax=Oceaniovalibus sp. ACAM 378 TaxID=2599923 RepID=UPI0011DAF18E|nr:TfoX/Sxy family protein [Oceaniovalibus sp. ACAM 378]TYB84443.1 TfoX/Sxy family protein [Oceaniovalibus sp. ACAM 378]